MKCVIQIVSFNNWKKLTACRLVMNGTSRLYANWKIWILSFKKLGMFWMVCGGHRPKFLSGQERWFRTSWSINSQIFWILLVLEVRLVNPPNVGCNIRIHTTRQSNHLNAGLGTENLWVWITLAIIVTLNKSEGFLYRKFPCSSSRNSRYTVGWVR
jgi:hypothetical protein